MNGDNDRDGQAAEITIAEAALLMVLTEQAVRHRIRRRMLPARRVGARLWLLPRAAVEQAALTGRLRPGPRPATPTDDHHSEPAG